MARSAISTESLLDLRRRLSSLPPRSSARRQIMQETAALFGVSEATVYRALQHPGKPRALQRADRGLPRILPRAERERSVELSAAIKQIFPAHFGERRVISEGYLHSCFVV